MPKIIILLRSKRFHPEKTFPEKTVILHSNDVHGALDGYAKAAALRTVYQDIGAEVFLVDAGDFMQGSPYVGLSKGASAMTMMNAAGYSLAAIGNHEFDYGIDQLENVLAPLLFRSSAQTCIKTENSFWSPARS